MKCYKCTKFLTGFREFKPNAHKVRLNIKDLTQIEEGSQKFGCFCKTIDTISGVNKQAEQL